MSETINEILAFYKAKLKKHKDSVIHISVDYLKHFISDLKSLRAEIEGMYSREQMWLALAQSHGKKMCSVCKKKTCSDGWCSDNFELDLDEINKIAHRLSKNEKG